MKLWRMYGASLSSRQNKYEKKTLYWFCIFSLVRTDASEGKMTTSATKRIKQKKQKSIEFESMR